MKKHKKRKLFKKNTYRPDQIDKRKYDLKVERMFFQSGFFR